VGTYDRSSKWLIEHHGDSILRLAGIGPVESWRALQAEVIQPGQLPDGLIEATLVGEVEPRLFIIEIATYPERRVAEQLYRDALLVLLDRKVLPELIVIVLCPKGNLQVASRVELSTPSGNTRLTLEWKVVELWNLSGEELLEIGDPGLAPWISLTKTQETPEQLLERCRELVDRCAAFDDRNTLLTVAQVLASLRYNVDDVLRILGGPEGMIESPLLDRIEAEGAKKARVEAISRLLHRRFGTLDPGTQSALKAVPSDEKLIELFDRAYDCESLSAFNRFLRG
jgi:hypothetical protein